MYEKLSNALSKILPIIIICLVIYIIFKPSDYSNYSVVTDYKPTPEERVEELEEEVEELEDELSSISSKNEELESELEDSKALIDMLQDQLWDNGIEPYEL